MRIGSSLTRNVGPLNRDVEFLLMRAWALRESRRHRISTSLSIRSGTRGLFQSSTTRPDLDNPDRAILFTCASLRAPDVRQRAEHDNGSVAPQSGPSHEVSTSSVALLRSAPVHSDAVSTPVHPTCAHSRSVAPPGFENPRLSASGAL